MDKIKQKIQLMLREDSSYFDNEYECQQILKLACDFYGDIFEFVIEENRILISKFYGTRSNFHAIIPDFVYGFKIIKTAQYIQSPFTDCVNLERITLGRGLRDLSYMLYGVKLKEIEGIDSWDVNRILSFESLFEESELEKIGNLGKWDISHGINLSKMFKNTKIKNIGDISQWNLSNAENISEIFYQSEVENFGKLDKWKVSSISNFSGAFANSKIPYIGDLSKWQVCNAVNMFSMFDNSKIENIGDICNWNTSKVENMSRMFKDTCMKNVGDLSLWEVDSIKSMNDMFYKSDIKNIGDISNWHYSLNNSIVELIKDMIFKAEQKVLENEESIIVDNLYITDENVMEENAEEILIGQKQYFSLNEIEFADVEGMIFASLNKKGEILFRFEIIASNDRSPYHEKIDNIKIYHKKAFNTKARRITETVGKNYEWKNAFNENGDESGRCLTFKDHEITKSYIQILDIEKNNMIINWSGTFDIGLNEKFDKNVCFNIKCTVPIRIY